MKNVSRTFLILELALVLFGGTTARAEEFNLQPTRSEMLEKLTGEKYVAGQISRLAGAVQSTINDKLLADRPAASRGRDYMAAGDIAGELASEITLRQIVRVYEKEIAMILVHRGDGIGFGAKSLVDLWDEDSTNGYLVIQFKDQSLLMLGVDADDRLDQAKDDAEVVSVTAHVPTFVSVPEGLRARTNVNQTKAYRLKNPTTILKLYEGQTLRVSGGAGHRSQQVETTARLQR